jgi:hypothetical protein
MVDQDAQPLAFEIFERSGNGGHRRAAAIELPGDYLTRTPPDQIEWLTAENARQHNIISRLLPPFDQAATPSR